MMSIAFIVLFTTYTMAQNSISIQRMIGFPTEERGFDKGVSACFCGVINGYLHCRRLQLPRQACGRGWKKAVLQGYLCSRTKCQ